MCDRENVCLLNHHLYRASGVKKSQIEQSLNPTHEGMVKVTSVLIFLKHNTTCTEHPECKNTFFVQLINY